MSSDDDGEDNEIEASRQHPESSWEGVETELVQSGVERPGDERKDSLEEREDGEGSPHLLTAQQFRQIGPEQLTIISNSAPHST